MCEMTVEVRLAQLMEEAEGYKTIRQFLNDVGGLFGKYIADWEVRETEDTPIGDFGPYEVVDPDGAVLFVIDTFGQTINEVVHYVEVNMTAFKKYVDPEAEMDYMKCQLCESGDMEYRSIPNPKAMNEEKVTHIWVCNQCPNVMLEWYDHSDSEALLRGLN